MPAVKDQHKMMVTFQLPSLDAVYTKKADEYLSHLVGHEGAGSLLSALKVCLGHDDSLRRPASMRPLPHRPHHGTARQQI